MLKEDREFLVWVVSLLIGFLLVLPSLYAEDSGVSRNAFQEEQVQKRLEYWNHLKQRDPAAFERQIQRTKAQIKDRFSSLKERNPRRFEALQGRYLEHRRERLQRLRRERPEVFRRQMQEKTQRLHQWRERNPERYQRFLENHPRIAQQVRRGAPFFGSPQRKEALIERRQGSGPGPENLRRVERRPEGGVKNRGELNRPGHKREGIQKRASRGSASGSRGRGGPRGGGGRRR